MSIAEIIAALAPGMVVVLQVTGLSTLIVLVASIALAVALSSQIPAVRRLAVTYVRVFRSIPILALMMLLFFGLGALNSVLNVSAFWGTVLAICIVETAYTSEVYRGAIASIDAKQWEAGLSLGLSRVQIYRFIIWKQALVPAVPLTLNMMIWVIKATALASLITLNEVTLRANALIVQHAQPLLVYSIVLLAYVIITVPLGYVGRWVESVVGMNRDTKPRLARSERDLSQEVVVK